MATDCIQHWLLDAIADRLPHVIVDRLHATLPTSALTPVVNIPVLQHRSSSCHRSTGWSLEFRQLQLVMSPSVVGHRLQHPLPPPPPHRLSCSSSFSNCNFDTGRLTIIDVKVIGQQDSAVDADRESVNYCAGSTLSKKLREQAVVHI